MPGFERFTDAARRVVVHAFEEAGYDRPIGTDHLYRALLRDPDIAELVERLHDFPNGVPPADRSMTILSAADQPLKGAVYDDELESPAPTAPGIRRVPGAPSEGYTPQAAAAIDLSLKEALISGHSFIAPEHLLLALIRQGVDDPSQAIVDSGIRLGAARWQANVLTERRQAAMRAFTEAEREREREETRRRTQETGPDAEPDPGPDTGPDTGPPSR